MTLQPRHKSKDRPYEEFGGNDVFITRGDINGNHTTSMLPSRFNERHGDNSFFNDSKNNMARQTYMLEKNVSIQSQKALKLLNDIQVR